MFGVDHVSVSGNGYEDVANRGGLSDRHHAEAVHHCLNRFDRIDFSHDHVRTHAASAKRNAFTTPAITDDDEVSTGKQDVRCANDAVERRLPSAVTIVEEVLRLRVVDGDRREGQNAGPLHCLETLNAGGCFFSRTDDLLDL